MAKQWAPPCIGESTAYLHATFHGGKNNNKLFVIPEWRMVIVRFGLDEQDRKITNQECGEFLRLVGESLKD